MTFFLSKLVHAERDGDGPQVFFVVMYVAVTITFAACVFYALVTSRAGFLSRSGAIASSFIVLFLAMAYCAAADIYFYSIGGSALIGKVENGRYFLGDHGRYTEVSEGTWRSSYWHERASSWVALLFFLVFIVSGLFQARRSAGRDQAANAGDGVGLDATKRSDGSPSLRTSEQFAGVMGSRGGCKDTSGVHKSAQSSAVTSKQKVLLLAEVGGAMLLGGLCARLLLRFLGAGILWQLPVVVPLTLLSSFLGDRCAARGGRCSACRGIVAVVLAFAGLVGASVGFSIVYRLLPEMICAPPEIEDGIFGVFMLALLVIMDAFYAAGFVSTVHAAFGSAASCSEMLSSRAAGED